MTQTELDRALTLAGFAQADADKEAIRAYVQTMLAWAAPLSALDDAPVAVPAPTADLAALRPDEEAPYDGLALLAGAANRDGDFYAAPLAVDTHG